MTPSSLYGSQSWRYTDVIESCKNVVCSEIDEYYHQQSTWKTIVKNACRGLEGRERQRGTEERSCHM